MKKIFIIGLVCLVFAGIAYARDYEVTKKVGQYTVEAAIDRNPPVVGNNNITVGIKDETGKQMTDAQVRVEYSMPAMPGMPPMNYKTDAQLQGKVYKAVMNLSMAGPWNITVKFKKDDKIRSMKFNIDVR
jgi:hypothetical protein